MSIRRCRGLALAALLAALATPAVAHAQETYELELEWKAPKVGHISEHVLTDAKRNALQIVDGVGTLMQEENESRELSFKATTEILAVDGANVTRERRTFHEAKEYGEPLAFQGKTIVATRGPDRWSFAYEDGAAVGEDLIEDVAEGFGRDVDISAGDREGLFEKAILPKGPVKVGESWKPDLGALAKDIDPSLDASTASGECTLVSAERRDGAVYGKLTCKMSFAMAQLGPMPLEQAIPMTFELTIEGCLDGSSPDGTGTMSFSFKGESAIKAPGAPKVIVDIGGRAKRTAKTKGKEKPPTRKAY